MMNNLSEPSKCCGCGLCNAVCPINAIQISEGERGVLHYSISDNCINCGKCKNICPNEKYLFHPKQNHFYKAITKDKNVLKKSSSGGIAHEIASYILRHGGVVYGAGWNKKTQTVEHMKIDKIDLLMIIQGSKYVQSIISKSLYKDVLENIKTRKVLFIGTPCQVAAIRSYTRDAQNLYCIDLICHGVPSMQMFSKQLKKITKQPINSISFRSGLDFSLNIETDKKVYKRKGLDNPYFSLFLQFVTLRESCYNCDFACNERVGDITLGDYVENNCGYSCVVINDHKGEILIDSIQNAIEFDKREIELLKSNDAYNEPTKKNLKTKKFTYFYSIYGLYAAYYLCFPLFVFKRFIRKILGNNIYSYFLAKLKK